MKNKSLKALLTIFFLSNYANASLFWDVNVGASQLRKNNNNFAFEYLQGYVNNNPNDEYGYYWLAKAYKKKKNKNDKKKNNIICPNC